MLFYPLWVLFWQFSWEPSVPPLPVGVDKGWLKPRCEACIEHMLAHVYRSVWFVRSEWTNMVNRCCANLYWRIFSKNAINKKPFLGFYIMFQLFLLFHLLSWLAHLPSACFPLPVVSSFIFLSLLLSCCFPLPPSSTSIWLLCLRELASKLSAASGLKAISSASLPLQVHAWDW